jgi:hypothetical protein
MCMVVVLFLGDEGSLNGAIWCLAQLISHLSNVDGELFIKPNQVDRRSIFFLLFSILMAINTKVIFNKNKLKNPKQNSPLLRFFFVKKSIAFH